VRYIVMSFKPLYAHEIISQVKDCEVRTYFGRLNNGDKVVIYSSSPEKAFIGEFTIYELYVGSYIDVCKYVERRCSLFDELNWDFIKRKYSTSRRKLVVIKISNVVKYSKPISLNEIKQYIPEFRPPLSYAVVPKEFIRLIHTHVIV